MNDPNPARATRGRPTEGHLFTQRRAAAAPLDDGARAPADRDIEALCRSAASAANDDALADFAPGSAPRVTLDARAPVTLTKARFYTDVAADCVEVLAAVARHRFEGPSANVAAREQRILALTDALLAVGPHAVDVLRAFFPEAAAASDPWKIWAHTFALARIAGADTRAALVDGLASIPRSALAHVTVAAEALALVRRGDALRLDERLGALDHPVLRAVQLNLRARAGLLAEGELGAALTHAEAAIADAALRAVDRAAAIPAAAFARVRALLAHPSPVVAYRAARALTLHGDARPIEALRAGEPLAAHLGPRALELFVLAGTPADLSAMDRLLGVVKTTPAALSAIGRFGHPRAFSWLAFSLQDPGLAEAAANALATLFGERVSPVDRLRPEAWASAVAALRPDPDTRLRCGQPWRPGLVAAEIEAGALSRSGLAARLDELRARAGVTPRVDLAAFAPDVEPAVQDVLRATSLADTASGAAMAGRWSRAFEPGAAPRGAGAD